MPSFERICTYSPHHLGPLLLDTLNGIGSAQTEYAPPEIEEDVHNAVIEAIHFSLLLGLFIDQVAVPMHLGHQPVIPGMP